MSFRDRVVLITGAASGIGRQLALRLSSMGAKIAAIDLNAGLLAKLRADIPGTATAVADVTDLAAVRAAVAELEKTHGPADTLVACAGIGRGTPCDAFRAEDFAAVIDVNLIGVVNSIDAVLPAMRRNRRGHLVVLSSLASYRGMPLMSAYSASKAACNALFDSLRVELAADGIRTTTICPGWIRTPMTAHLGLPDRDTMPVEAAVEKMITAIAAESPYVAFPSGLAWMLWALRVLPRSWGDRVISRHLSRARKMMSASAGT